MLNVVVDRDGLVEHPPKAGAGLAEAHEAANLGDMEVIGTVFGGSENAQPEHDFAARSPCEGVAFERLLTPAFFILLVGTGAGGLDEHVELGTVGCVGVHQMLKAGVGGFDGGDEIGREPQRFHGLCPNLDALGGGHVFRGDEGVF